MLSSPSVQIDNQLDFTCSIWFSHDKFTSAVLALGFGKSNDVGRERRIIITRLRVLFIGFVLTRTKHKSYA